MGTSVKEDNGKIITSSGEVRGRWSWVCKMSAVTLLNIAEADVSRLTGITSAILLTSVIILGLVFLYERLTGSRSLDDLRESLMVDSLTSLGTGLSDVLTRVLEDIRKARDRYDRPSRRRQQGQAAWQ
ncbi:uncharacterized protein [Panulirus ornatus]|uniref:uncharacterized protein isoform X1 n=2 Tax=Panulirus ornatus TaxID=150431 RepID=UPI003A868E04